MQSAVFAGCAAGPNEKRLLANLLDKYNTLERPVANESEPVIVSFGLTLMQIIDVVSYSKQSKVVIQLYAQRSLCARRIITGNPNNVAQLFPSRLRSICALSVPLQIRYVINLGNCEMRCCDETFHIFLAPCKCRMRQRWRAINQSCLQAFTSTKQCKRAKCIEELSLLFTTLYLCCKRQYSVSCRVPQSRQKLVLGLLTCRCVTVSQDEKNQILTTNAWLNLVSITFRQNALHHDRT